MEIVCAPSDLFYRGISSISFPSETGLSRSRAQKLRELADRVEIAMRCHGAGLRCSCGFHSLHVIRAQSGGIRRPEMRRFPDRARKRFPIQVVRKGVRKERTLDVIAMGFFSGEVERFQRAQRQARREPVLVVINARK